MRLRCFPILAPMKTRCILFPIMIMTMMAHRLAQRLFSVSAKAPTTTTNPPCQLREQWPAVVHRFQACLNEHGEFPLFKSSVSRTPHHHKDHHHHTHKNQNQKQAAVLVLLCTVDGESSVLFTRRSSRLRRHAAEISFPGGHVDATDASVVHTALRETAEELLPRPGFWDDHPIEILGPTSQLSFLKGPPITPVVGVLWHPHLSHATLDDIFPGSPDEVEHVFAVSIQTLLEVETSRALPPNRFRLRHGPVFPTAQGDIWGLTAYILRPLLHKLLRPELYDTQQQDDDDEEENEENP